MDERTNEHTDARTIEDTVGWGGVAAFCLQFAGAWADAPWDPERPVFKVGKRIFAMPAPGVSGCPLTIAAKGSPELSAAWAQHPNVFRPAYVGRFGWIGIRVTDRASWEMAQLLIEESYMRVAPRRPRRASAASQGPTGAAREIPSPAPTDSSDRDN